MRRTVTFIFLVLLCFPDEEARSDECEPVASRLTSSVPNLTFVRRDADQTGTSIAFKHAKGASVELTCSVGITPQIALEWSSNYPPSDFFDLAGKVGSILTAARPDGISSGVRRCYQAAAQQPPNKLGARHSDLKTIGTSLDCTLSVDPSQTTILIDRLE